MYNNKVLNLFSKPKNVGVLQGASGVGQFTNKLTNDVYKLYLKVEDDIIVDANFKAFCGADGIAVFSVLTELLKGQNIAQEQIVDIKDIELQVGDLGAENNSIDDALQTLKNAVTDYNKKQEKLRLQKN